MSRRGGPEGSYCEGRVVFRTPSTQPRTVSRIVRMVFEEAVARGVTISEMANHVGLSRIALQYWKAGRNNPDPMYIEALADFLGMKFELVKA